VENATMTWILTGRWGEARQLLEASAASWADDVRTSNARLQVLDLVQTGHASGVERWRRQLESPAAEGAPVTDARGVLALAAATSGDLAGMRAELAPLWGMDRVLMYDDQLWWLVLLAARAEADAAAAGPVPDRVAAAAHLQAIGDVAGRFRRYGPLGEVWPLDLAAQLERFHGRDARPALRSALAGWERLGHDPDAAVTHLALAEQEAVHGDRSVAREQLLAGREIARRLEAVPLLARADALAATYGLTSRDRRTDQVLTEREVEVLRLVADGLTNGQIGGRLFMSPKTASVHVSHILAKLGAANRTEAAATARRQGLLG
jgi:DNA-binding CsgD family transcriptional regulator